MKIHHFQCDITPEPGTLLAGYGPHVVSRGIHDPLMVCGAFLEDSRKNRMLLLSFDLLGLDSDIVKKIRESAAKILHLPPEAVIASCTHTHAGPHTRSIAGCVRDNAYLKKLDIAKKWYKEYWGLDMFELRKEVRQRQNALNTFVKDNVTIYDYQ